MNGAVYFAVSYSLGMSLEEFLVVELWGLLWKDPLMLLMKEVVLILCTL
jgi:hypothetical protein